MLGRTRLSKEEKIVYFVVFVFFWGFGSFIGTLVNILTLMINWFEVKSIFQKIKYLKLYKKYFKVILMKHLTEQQVH